MPIGNIDLICDSINGNELITSTYHTYEIGVNNNKNRNFASFLSAIARDRLLYWYRYKKGLYYKVEHNVNTHYGILFSNIIVESLTNRVEAEDIQTNISEFRENLLLDEIQCMNQKDLQDVWEAIQRKEGKTGRKIEDFKNAYEDHLNNGCSIRIQVCSVNLFRVIWYVKTENFLIRRSKEKSS